MLLIISGVILLIVLSLHNFGNWEIISREEGQYFNLPLIEKIKLLAGWYGLFFPLFFLIAIYNSIKESTKLLLKIEFLTILLH